MFEDDLKSALPRVEPPEGFANRVMARLDEPVAAPLRRPSRFSAWAAAAAMACASLAGVAVYQQRAHELHERERALAARDQLVLALQITGKKLDAVRDQINDTDSKKHSEAQIQ